MGPELEFGTDATVAVTGAEMPVMVDGKEQATWTSFSVKKGQVLSFGFKHGIPGDADLVIDVRFLVNPYFVPELKDLDGETEAVKRFVLKNDDARLFLLKYFDLLDYLIPLYEKEGKAYLTIAIGCTGGRHRSVAIAQRLYEHVQTAGREVVITHRDIDQQ